jgi:glycosyltransferase involved in cell wall biosynthesis
MGPKFSVIIPVHNGVKYIQKAVDSVLAQRYKAHEIWVIDDGSTDATPDVLAAYGGLIRTRRIPNSGASGARNAAVRMATGDHLAFLDADDLWFKDKLETVAAYALKYPGAGFIASNQIVRYAHRGNRLVRHYSTLRDRRRLEFDRPMSRPPFKFLLHSNFIGTPSGVVIRKDVMDRAGLFDEKVKYVEDLELWLRAATLTDFLLIERPLFFKRTHSTNLSNDALATTLSHRAVLERALVEHADFIARNGLASEARRSLAKIDYRVGHLLFEKGRKREAFEAYAKGLRRSADPLNAAQFVWAASKKTLRKGVRRISPRV